MDDEPKQWVGDIADEGSALQVARWILFKTWRHVRAVRSERRVRTEIDGGGGTAKPAQVWTKTPASGNPFRRANEVAELVRLAGKEAATHVHQVHRSTHTTTADLALFVLREQIIRVVEEARSADASPVQVVDRVASCLSSAGTAPPVAARAAELALRATRGSDGRPRAPTPTMVADAVLDSVSDRSPDSIKNALGAIRRGLAASAWPPPVKERAKFRVDLLKRVLGVHEADDVLDAENVLRFVAFDVLGLGPADLRRLAEEEARRRTSQVPTAAPGGAGSAGLSDIDDGKGAGSLRTAP